MTENHAMWLLEQWWEHLSALEERELECATSLEGDVIASGRQFGLLRVVKPTRQGWQCRCSCGRWLTVEEPDLLSGRTKHCDLLMRHPGLITPPPPGGDTVNDSRPKRRVALRTEEAPGWEWFEKPVLRGTIDKEQWEFIKRVYKNRCAYCHRREKLTMDHVFPWIKGGPTEPWNIVPACRSCNARKGAQLPTEILPVRVML